VPAAVVESLDVFEDRAGELEPGVPPLPFQQLGLHRGPNASATAFVIGSPMLPRGGQQACGACALGEDSGHELSAVITTDEAAG
jgi:hypothetical protein